MLILHLRLNGLLTQKTWTIEQICHCFKNKTESEERDRKDRQEGNRTFMGARKKAEKEN